MAQVQSRDGTTALCAFAKELLTSFITRGKTIILDKRWDL